MNKYQRILSKLAIKDIDMWNNLSYYAAKKFNKHLYNGFKGVDIYKAYQTIPKSTQQKRSKEKIEYIISEAEATMALSGFTMTEEDKALGRRMLSDEITVEEAIEIIKNSIKE